MEFQIRNLNDLDSEIMRLESLKTTQGEALADRFSSPSAILGTALSLFPKSKGTKSSGVFNQDFVGLISRLLLPVLLNKTLFRHSNFLVKSLVSIVSQKASHFISEENVLSIWGKLTALFGKKKD